MKLTPMRAASVAPATTATRGGDPGAAATAATSAVTRVANGAVVPASARAAASPHATIPPTLHLHVRRVVIHGELEMQERWTAASLAATLQHLLEQPGEAADIAHLPGGVAALASALRTALREEGGRYGRR